MKIKPIIKKIKPAVSVITFLLGILMFSLPKENIDPFWEGMGIFLLFIGIISFSTWTLGAES